VSDLFDELRARMEANASASGAAGLRLPPRVFEEMEAALVAFDAGAARLRVRFPVLERFQNPMGHLQGGAITMAVDNCIGPLSYLVAPPSATTELTTTYLRPVTAEDEVIEVEAWLVERVGRRLVFDARVTNARGETVALARAACQVLRG
jgi:uncharacterized protein (TIGR00369 family)